MDTTAPSPLAASSSPPVGGRAEPLVHRPARALARRLLPSAVAVGVAPTALTVAWIILGVLAGGALALGTRAGAVVAVVAVAVGYVLDCLDGEVARATRRTSALGGFLEGLGQWVVGLAVLTGAAVGADALAWLAPAIAAGATFHLVYLQLPSAVGPDLDVPAARRMSRALYPLMPVELNVVLVAAVLGAPVAGLLVWTVVAVLAVLVLVGSFVAASSPERPNAVPSRPRQEIP